MFSRANSQISEEEDNPYLAFNAFLYTEHNLFCIIFEAYSQILFSHYKMLVSKSSRFNRLKVPDC